MLNLTSRQQETFDFILKYINDWGYPPSYREIALALGINSTNAIKEKLDALVKKGYIQLDKKTARGIRILKKK